MSSVPPTSDDDLVRFHCPGCWKRLKALPAAVGKPVKCGKCTQLILVPPPTDSADTHDGTEALTVEWQPEVEPLPAAIPIPLSRVWEKERANARREKAEAAPVTPPRRSGGNPLPYILLAVGTLAAIGVIWYAVSLARDANEENRKLRREVYDLKRKLDDAERTVPIRGRR
ncbi:MAG: hypothetical protein ABGY75_07075 [Gemmataceae bacterium]